VKLVRQRHGDAVLQQLSALTNELRVLRHLRHPNIVGIHGAVVDVQRQQVSLVLELVRGRTLEHFMRMGVPETSGETVPATPEPGARCQVCLDLCRAFLYLHSRRPRIVHSDLKSANILVEGDGKRVRSKLLDFGLARVLSRGARPRGGTPRWMAPEVFQSSAAELKCSADVFSFGMLLHFVATGRHAREGMSRESVERALRTAQPVSLHWPLDSAFELLCRPLAEDCVQVDEQRRPSFTVVHRLVSAWAWEPGISGQGGAEADLDQAEAWEWHAAMRQLQRLWSTRPMPQSIGNTADPARHGGSEVQPGRGEHRALQPGSALPLSERLPAVQEEAPLALQGSLASPVARAAPLLLIPRFAATKEAAMTMTLLHARLRWNYEVPSSCCCTYHASTRLLVRLSQKLHTRPCRAERPDIHAGQCSHCGILNRNLNTVCEVCGRSNDSSGRPRQRLEAL